MEHVALKIQRRRYSKSAVHEISVHRNARSDATGGDGIIALREAFLHDGHICMAFEKHGVSLDDALTRPLAPARVRRVTRQLLGALEALHRSGYAHTDVKPDNILYDTRTGDARLADLGSASRELEQASAFGTREYTPPEVLIGSLVSPAIDMWSLGCTVFQMLTGRLLFDPRRAAAKKYREFSNGADAVEIPLGEAAQADLTAEKAEQFEPGAIIAGKYELEKSLGQGRFATVWSARKLNDNSLDGTYATLWGYAQTVKRNSPTQAGANEKGRDRDRAWRKARGADDILDLALNYEHILEIIRLRGPFPEQMIQTAEFRDGYFEQDCAVRFRPAIRPISMRSLLRRATTLRDHALGAATDFLDGLLAIHPAARPTATAALAHPWLK